MSCCNNTRIVQVTSGATAVDFSALTPTQIADLCITILANCNVAVALQVNAGTGDLELVDGQGDILSTISNTPTAVEDADGDTSVTTVEGGGAGGGDRTDFIVDGVTLMSLEAGKLSLNGILIDPPIGLELEQQAAVPAAATDTNNTLWINSANGQLYRGAVNLETLSSIGDVALADGVDISPTTPGAPTLAEAQAAITANGTTSAVFRYDGTATPTAASATYVYLVDAAGNAYEIVSPSTASNIYTDDGIMTGNRTVTGNDFSLTLNTLGAFTADANDGAGVYGRVEASQGAASLSAADPLVTTTVSVAPGLYAAVVNGFAGTNQIEVTNDGVNLDFTATSDLEIDGSAGVAGQVLASQGPNLPPVWQNAVTVDLNTTVSDQSGGNYGGGAAVGAPATPDDGDLHIEIYDDGVAYFSATGGAFPAVADVFQSNPLDTHMLNTDLTATGARTHAFSDFGQTWNNLGALDINQDIAAFPGFYASTTWTTGGFDMEALNSAGSRGDLDVDPGVVALNFTDGAGDTGGFAADVTNGTVLEYDGSAGGQNRNAIEISDTDLDLIIGAASDLKVNGASGTAGQVLQSAGPGVPPTWATVAVGATKATGVADGRVWWDAGNMEFMVEEATDVGNDGDITPDGTSVWYKSNPQLSGITVNASSDTPTIGSELLIELESLAGVDRAIVWSPDYVQADGTLINTLGHTLESLSHHFYRFKRNEDTSGNPVWTLIYSTDPQLNAGGGGSLFDTNSQVLSADRTHDLNGNNFTLIDNTNGGSVSFQAGDGGGGNYGLSIQGGGNQAGLFGNGGSGGNLDGFFVNSGGLNLQFQGNGNGGTQDLSIDADSGTAGQYLGSNGNGAAPTWQDVGNSRFFISETDMNPASAGAPTELEINNAFIAAIGSGLEANTLVVYNGTNVESNLPTHAWWFDQDNDRSQILYPGGGGSLFDVEGTLAVGARNANLNGNEFYFIDSTDGSGAFFSAVVGDQGSTEGRGGIGASKDEGFVQHQSASGDHLVSANINGINLQIDTAGDLRLNNDAGLAGQVILSQGVDVQPVWSFVPVPVNTLADIPAVATVVAGQQWVVVNDGANNGMYAAVGAAVGSAATSIDKLV